MQERFRVTVSDHLGRPADPGRLAAWLTRVAPRRIRGTVNVAIVSDRRVRALNYRYRGKDSTTDVLSFPAFARLKHPRALPRQTRPSSLEPRDPNAVLGDIVIA